MTQNERVKKRLIEHSYVTRNQCLRNNITRLAARIDDLRKEGMKIEGAPLVTARGKDYKYTLVEYLSPETMEEKQLAWFNSL